MLREFVTIPAMRIFPGTALLLLVALLAPAQDQPAPCRVGDPQCTPAEVPPSKAELKKAHHDYQDAQKLIKQNQLPEAADLLDQALELAPKVPDYVQLRDLVRQKQVSNCISRGDNFMEAGRTVEAMAEYRQAVALDPQNEYASQRLQDSLPTVSAPPAEPLSPSLEVVSQSKPVILSPQPGFKDLHFKGTTRTVLEQIAGAFGIKVMFDDSVNSKPLRFEMDGVDFFTAFREASSLAHLFWVPLTPKQLIVANDTQALRRELEHTISAEFYLSNATSAQEVNDIVNMMRTLFDVRFAVAQPGNNSVAVRAPATIVEAAAKVLENFLTRKPQVTLDIQVFAISHSMTRSLGISPPTSFQMINVGAAALALLGQGNVQNLINQLIASGGINAANSTALQTLLAQLQNQQSNSILQTLSQTPFFTFGGGKTLFAVTVPPLTATAQLNTSDMQSIDQVTLRTQQGNAATLKIGERYPVLNATFAPIYNTPQIAQVIGNGSYTAPFPSITYEDLGLVLKATPQVLSDNTVTLKLEMQVKALAGQSVNGVPILSNREFTGTISVLDGSTAAIAGMIDSSEQKNLSGLPGFSLIPGFSYLTSTHTKQIQYDELLVVVTPHVVSPAHSPDDSPEVWIPSS